MVVMEGWQSKAECNNYAFKVGGVISDHVFFIGRGRPSNTPRFLKFCGYCPVRTECLYYAVANNLDGIWGGMTKSQRDLLPPTYRQEIIQQALAEGWYEPWDTVSEPVPEYQSLEFEDLEELDLSALG